MKRLIMLFIVGILIFAGCTRFTDEKMKKEDSSVKNELVEEITTKDRENEEPIDEDILPVSKEPIMIIHEGVLRKIICNDEEIVIGEADKNYNGKYIELDGVNTYNIKDITFENYANHYVANTNDKWIGKSNVLVKASHELMPRDITSIYGQKEMYLDVVAKILEENQVMNAVPSIKEIYQVDINNNGDEEILIHATNTRKMETEESGLALPSSGMVAYEILFIYDDNEVKIIYEEYIRLGNEYFSEENETLKVGVLNFLKNSEFGVFNTEYNEFGKTPLNIYFGIEEEYVVEGYFNQEVVNYKVGSYDIRFEDSDRTDVFTEYVWNNIQLQGIIDINGDSILDFVVSSDKFYDFEIDSYGLIATYTYQNDEVSTLFLFAEDSFYVEVVEKRMEDLFK